MGRAGLHLLCKAVILMTSSSYLFLAATAKVVIKAGLDETRFRVVMWPRLQRMRYFLWQHRLFFNAPVPLGMLYRCGEEGDVAACDHCSGVQSTALGASAKRLAAQLRPYLSRGWNSGDRRTHRRSASLSSRLCSVSAERHFMRLANQA